ncbi:putative fatty aldehyde dehydrogenase protein [Phaeoacremonium minimum UCRPA7]|uniref:Aldehyde dehydrogenase n=1 Tax=Phaeoacremonium minimum (strain UCR-PA7) TaxID=1286976 RepID=R8BLZ9_PHAM7|nr:putative fatty aldehyde dehydrogenase protein [Phaeoacremonium minimum UCRPA7]EOO00352.1 putative fatty aldehyde dehydrogenase protein [Phaeoacremonium minimum UCRPA7]
MDLKGDLIPAYRATDLDAIPQICQTVRSTFRTNKTKSIEWRKVQLRKLYWAMVDHTPQLEEAMRRDLHRSTYEAHLTEIGWVKNDCVWMCDHLDKFASEQRFGSPFVPFIFAAHKIRSRPEPLGASLIIGTYNYPIMLILVPLVGAIAAGCTAVIKPSEGAPNTAMAIQEMLEKNLDTSAFRVVNGAVPETTALLEEKWDKIFYTGGSQVGKIIAVKAAETLTPITLELGGRNPAIVTKNANPKLAARRLLWAKALNAGQVCLSHNYVLVEKEVVDEFIKGLNEAYNQFFPNGAKQSPDFSRIINERHFLRMKKMLDESKGKIVMGGEIDQSELYIAPTAVLVDSYQDSMVEQESFGPIFAVLPVNTLSEAINIANAVDRTPLALFTFGTKAENQRVLHEITSGGATMNDSFFHASMNNVPFGGVGGSGMGGASRGKAGFDAFTHYRSVAETPAWMEKLIRIRYMPYKWSEMKRMSIMRDERPNFDRNGRVIKGLSYWIRFVLGLGGKEPKARRVQSLLYGTFGDMMGILY